MRTVGVDLSSAPQRTAAAAIEWGRGEAVVEAPVVGLDDSTVAATILDADWSGIDAPFGWPEAMVEAIYAYAFEGRWPEIDKDAFRYRLTDRFVRSRIAEQTEHRLSPLSVSSDRIALTAYRAAGLRERVFRRGGMRFDRAGGDQIVEVYPAAALLLWGLDRSGYKSGRRGERAAAAREARESLLTAIEEGLPSLRWTLGAREACVESDDALDAMLCALIARASARGLTEPPPAEALERARGEGWIHLPRRDSLSLLCAESSG